MGVFKTLLEPVSVSLNTLKMKMSVLNTCNERIFWPAAEPVHGATRYQCRKLQRSVAELFPDGGKAQDDVEIVSNP